MAEETKTKPAKNGSIKKPVTKKPIAKASKPTTKTAPKKTEEIKAPAMVKATRKPRVPHKVKITEFEEILKKKAELDAVTVKAKKHLQKEYQASIAQAEAIKAQYRELFDELIEIKKARAKRGSGKARKIGVVAPITKAEVAAFIEQTENGIAIADIKISGRRPKSIQKIATAYNKAEKKDASSVLALLK